MSKLPKVAGNLKCWRTLNKLVFGDGVSCPGCQGGLRENYRAGYLWCHACRRKYRPTAYRGSWLYGMKLRPRQLFLLLWCWQQRKSPDTACLVARVSYPTAARWYRRFRERTPDATAVLAGVVQIDESYFGRQRSQQAQRIVVGAIEPDTRRLALRITDSRSQEALEQFVTDVVQAGTLVVSDKWYGYQELPLLGYGHESWNHSEGQFAGTNQAEGVWSSLKRYLRKLYGCVPTRHLALVCREWVARQNSPRLFTSPAAFLAATVVPG